MKKKITALLKKVTVAMLALIMILCTFEMPVQASGHYDKDAALSYAANHWNDGKGLCAEFVSDCLSAGGVDCWSRSASSLRNQLINSGLGTEYVLPLEGGAIKASDYPGQIEAGSVIFYHCSGCTDGKPFIHTVLCAGITADGYVRAYSHNNANRGAYKYAYSTTCYSCGGRVDAAYVYTFSDPVAISMDSSDIYVNNKEQSTVGVHFSGDGIHTIEGNIDDSIASFSFDSVDWSNGYAVGRITANCPGTTVLRVTLRDDNGNVLNEVAATINVNVVTGNAYTSTDVLYLNTTDHTSDNYVVYFDCAPMGATTINPSCSNENIVDVTYGECTYDQLPVYVTALNPGETILTYTFVDAYQNQLAETSIKVIVKDTTVYSVPVDDTDVENTESSSVDTEQTPITEQSSEQGQTPIADQAPEQTTVADHPQDQSAGNVVAPDNTSSFWNNLNNCYQAAKTAIQNSSTAGSWYSSMWNSGYQAGRALYGYIRR